MDYTYVCLLDPETTARVREIQGQLAELLGHSSYAKEWEPHVTVSFGNILADEEVSVVREACRRVVAAQEPFTIRFSNLVTIEKTVQGETYHALRLKVAESDELDRLSQAVQEIARAHNVPFDAFTLDHYHVGLGRYATSSFDMESVSEIVKIEEMPLCEIASVSLFRSMLNEPRPERAEEMETFIFRKPQ